ncbi:MAG TPA: 50S ribosomal protein L21 [Gemmataceae bacterium]|nr:50S ribosomal protein L21 [Gemmataceae bacterium]
MYAVFVDGARQYKVSENEIVKVDFRDVEPGGRVEFGRVLLYSNGDDLRIGQPVVEGARVLGDVVEHPSIKLYIQHFRKRKNYRRLKGHRQWYTAVRVKHILLAGQEPPVAAPKPEASAPAPAPASETPAPAAPPAAK